MMHGRFKRKVWVFKSDLTGSLAKWLVRQSPYVVPDNLSICISKFHDLLDQLATFDETGMAEIQLDSLTPKVFELIEQVPEIVVLNEPKTGHNENVFVSRYHDRPSDPDDDFIDIMAIAQNITCDFAEREDAEEWLNTNRVLVSATGEEQ